jgi:CubicO group peptidase (beta-lactamase class C family)
MQKPFFTIGKLLISEKILSNEFEPYFKKFGKATIDTVTYSNKYQYTVQLSLEKDLSERAFLSFIFSEKGKVQGFGFTQPTLIYPKKEKGKLPKDFAEKASSVINKKHLSDSLNLFNGCVIVLDNGIEVFKNCYGYSNFETKTPLNENSRFDIASCGKQFTAIAIMLLVEQGKLNYSDNIKKYISEVPYENITIENLLTHTSGLPEYQNLLTKYWDKTKFATNYDVIELFQKHQPKLLFTPNESFSYCNTGYAFLSVIIEKVSGMSYSEFLDKNIFTPLDMKNTRVYNTRRSENEIINNFAYGYVYSNKEKKYVLPDSTSKYQHVIWMDAITGDGNIATSISDLIQWDKACREFELIDKSSWDRAYSKYKLSNGKFVNYGYGLFLLKEHNIEDLIYHTGGWPGYLSIILRLPEQEKTIVVLSNNSYDDFLRLADDITALILKYEKN